MLLALFFPGYVWVPASLKSGKKNKMRGITENSEMSSNCEIYLDELIDFETILATMAGMSLNNFIDLFA
jgi:hypothetical protein